MSYSRKNTVVGTSVERWVVVRVELTNITSLADLYTWSGS